MADPNLHECYFDIGGRQDAHLYNGYGPAVTSCVETEDGTLLAGNDEYESKVNFCPFCGFKARQQIVFGEQS
jgi:hypothetical protein